jgi:hypothetical protein
VGAGVSLLDFPDLEEAAQMEEGQVRQAALGTPALLGLACCCLSARNQLMLGLLQPAWLRLLMLVDGREAGSTMPP